MTTPATSEQVLVTRAPDAVRIEDLRLSLPVASGGRVTPEVAGLRLTVTNEGLAVVLGFAADLLTTVSRTRIDELLGAMEENPRLRPVRWYYASLFRVAGLRDELAITGNLIEGGVEIRARFAQAESGGFLRQMRDRARNLATVIVRLGLAADAGALRVRLDLSPDVNGTLAKLVLNGAGNRPGISRFDDTAVLVDLAALVAAQPDVPATVGGLVRRVDATGDRLVVEVG